MKYLLLTSLACLALACSDDDSPPGGTDAPADTRGSLDAGDTSPGTDRQDAGAEASADVTPDTADAASPDLPAPAMLEITPAVHDFGTVAKDGTETKHFTVKNLGGSSSGFLDVKLMNGTLDADAFATVASGCDGALEPEMTCDIEVRFRANVVGVHQGLLTAAAAPGGMVSAELKATVP